MNQTSLRALLINPVAQCMNINHKTVVTSGRIKPAALLPDMTRIKSIVGDKYTKPDLILNESNHFCVM